MSEDISSINPHDAWKLISDGACLVDVRTEAEYQSGHLPGAVNIPHDQLAARAAELKVPLDKQVVVYCKSGGRSDYAMALMRSMGYSAVENAGGYETMMVAKTQSTGTSRNW